MTRAPDGRANCRRGIIDFSGGRSHCPPLVSGDPPAPHDPPADDIGDPIGSVDVDVDVDLDAFEDTDADLDADADRDGGADFDDEVFAVIDIDVDIDVVTEPDHDTTDTTDTTDTNDTDDPADRRGTAFAEIAPLPKPDDRPPAISGAPACLP